MKESRKPTKTFLLCVLIKTIGEQAYLISADKELCRKLSHFTHIIVTLLYT